jgi:hypothetical protein
MGKSKKILPKISKNKKPGRKPQDTYSKWHEPYQNMYEKAKKEIDQLKKTIEIHEFTILYMKNYFGEDWNIAEMEYIKNDITDNIVLIDDYFKNMGYNIDKHLKCYNNEFVTNL